MSLKASDIVAITDARARLTELAEEVATQGTEKVFTKNGVGYVALIDAQKLDRLHALEKEFGSWVMIQDALGGLKALAEGDVFPVEGLRSRVAARVSKLKDSPLLVNGES